MAQIRGKVHKQYCHSSTNSHTRSRFILSKRVRVGILFNTMICAYTRYYFMCEKSTIYIYNNLYIYIFFCFNYKVIYLLLDYGIFELLFFSIIVSLMGTVLNINIGLACVAKQIWNIQKSYLYCLSIPI